MRVTKGVVKTEMAIMAVVGVMVNPVCMSTKTMEFISGSWKTGAINWAKQSLGDLPHGHSILLDEGGSPKLD